jgi:hypothetical protein
MLTSQNNKTQKKSNKTSAELKHVMELQSYTTGEHRCDDGLFWPLAQDQSSHWHNIFIFFLLNSEL